MFWYDRNVEEIVTPMWAWSLTNTVPNSNHLAGCAVDLNAPRYPWGLLRMPPEKVAKVEVGLRLFEGSVFWGRRWNRVDEMHYQMAWPESDPRNDRFAQKLLDGYLGIYQQQGSPAVDVLARATGLSIARASEILPQVAEGLLESDCTTINRIAMWLAQVGHESASFEATEERQSGDLSQDRWIYKGRTWIQITWAGNYEKFSRWCYDRGLVPSPSYFLDNPRLLADQRWAALGAAWYWTETRRWILKHPSLNEASDARDVYTATLIINGGTNGLTDRQRRYDRALAIGDGLLTLLAGDDDLTPEQNRKLNAIYDALFDPRRSKSLYASPDEGTPWTLPELVENQDGMTHQDFVEQAARLGHEDSIHRIVRVAAGQGIVAEQWALRHAKAVLETIPPDVLQEWSAKQ